MFFESSYYASPHIEDLLKKDDVQLVEFLDDDEILQEYKSQNKNLMQYFQRPDILDQLVTMIITEPPGDVADAVRFKHPNVACEILTTETPDMTERLIENHAVLLKLYSFLEQEAPLNPLLTSFFAKTFGMLIVKKTEQNWFAYQCVCIQVLEFIKSRERFLETMFRHVGTPAIMDLLFQIIINVEGPDLKNNLFNWLNEQKMVPRLINILGCDNDPEKHHNVAQFVCDLIAHSRQFRQSDLVERGAHKQQADDAGMSLLRALEAPEVTGSLLDIVLMDAERESTILAGIRIVLKLLEKPVINERDVSIAQMVQLAEDEHRKRLLDRLLPQVAHRIRDFVTLLQTPPRRPAIQNTVALLQPPFGQTRLQVCAMLTVLLRTENAAIERAICRTDFFATLAELFRTYCWNNLLHNQVRTCLVYALTPAGVGDTPLSALQTHIISKCKILTHLIDCWKLNNERVKSTQKRGARLGYMGQLIDILDVVTAASRRHDAYRTLVEDSFDGDAERLADWHRIAGQPPLTTAASAAAAVAEPSAFAEVSANGAGGSAAPSSPGDIEIGTDAAAAADAATEAATPAAVADEAATDALQATAATAGDGAAADDEVPAIATDDVTPAPIAAAAAAPFVGELALELQLQQTLLAGIDPYEKNESIFLTTDYDQDFSVDPEASERFAQACKSKDLHSANIDDILSGMLNIDDNDLFAMNDDDDDDDDEEDDDDDRNDDDNNRLHHSRHRRSQHRHRDHDFDYDRSGSDDDDDDDDDEDDDDDDVGYNAHRRTAANRFNHQPIRHRQHDEHDDDDDDDAADANADDDADNRTHRRQRHHRLTAQQQHRASGTSAALAAATAAAAAAAAAALVASGAHRNQLIIDSGDDNANVHGIDNLKFTDIHNFEISPWDTPASSSSSSGAAPQPQLDATSFFSNEVNFQANFPQAPFVAAAATTTTSTNPFAALHTSAGGGVSAVYDPVDPFGAFGPITGGGGGSDFDAVPFVFDAAKAAAAFGDFCADDMTVDSSSSNNADTTTPTKSEAAADGGAGQQQPAAAVAGFGADVFAPKWSLSNGSTDAAMELSSGAATVAKLNGDDDRATTTTVLENGGGGGNSSPSELRVPAVVVSVAGVEGVAKVEDQFE